MAKEFSGISASGLRRTRGELNKMEASETENGAER
jgi:hypothetical protein